MFRKPTPIIATARSYSLLLVLFVFLQNYARVLCRKSLFEVAYTNINPYIQVDKSTGKATGIIPDIFEFSDLFCHEKNTTDDYEHVLGYVSEIKTIPKILELLNSDTSYGENGTALEKISSDRAFWFPVLETIDVNAYRSIKARNLTLFHVKHLKKVAVVVSEKHIHLIEKVRVGLIHTSSVAILALIGGVLFSIIIWFIERWNKQDFDKAFIRGVGTGFWLTVVTMGTVGYGDITPKTCPGRSVAFLWMIVSVVFASVMTATISETVLGTDSLQLYHQKVTAIKKSPEENIVKYDYHGIYVPAEDINELIHNLEYHEAEYGLLNEDIAAAYQDDFQNADQGDESMEQLSFVYSIDTDIPIEFLVNMNDPVVEKYMKCWKEHKEEVVPSILSKYKQHISYEIVHHISVTKLFLQYPNLFYVCGACLAMIIVGLVYELCLWFKKPVYVLPKAELFKTALESHGLNRK